VADPDPYVFGPPGSGSVSHRYGSGSFSLLFGQLTLISTSVADPDPYVFGPSGSVNHRNGSGSFYNQAKIVFFFQAKIVRKTLIPTVLSFLYDFLSLKKDVNVPSKNNKQKNFFLAS
jgi:hypothetical protein